MAIDSTKKKPLSILVVNFHSTFNAGDAALLESTLRQLRSAFVDPWIVVSANYPDESYLHSLDVQVIPSFGAIIGMNKKPASQQVPRAIMGILLSGMAAFFPRAWKIFVRRFPDGWLKFIDAYRKADLVVNCPGNQFFTMGTFGWPFLISAVSIFCAHLFKKPVYVLPQSIGPLNRRWEKNLLKWLLTRARIVFVREPISLRLARDIGIPAEKVKFSPDLAFESTYVDRDSALACLECLGHDDSKGTVGVTAISRMTGTLKDEWFSPYYYALAASLERLVKKYGVRIYFFPQVIGPSPQEDDRIAAHKVAEIMRPMIKNMVIVEEQISPAMLKGLYGLMDIFVATRMHSGIFALSMGVPTLFIGYLTKIRGMVESLDLQEWLIELKEANGDYLWEKLEKLWMQRDAIRRRLVDTMPQVIEQTHQVGILIAEDYYGRA